MASSLYTVKGLCILDNDGKRIVSKYYDDSYPTVREQKAFEKSLFKKTHRANGDIIMFDGITCVYRSNVDLFFYVFGSASENELILSSVLNTLYDAICMVLRDMVERSTLYANIEAVMLIVDEMIDGGIILESDPAVLANGTRSSDKDVPISEQTLSQAVNTAGGFFRRTLLS